MRIRKQRSPTGSGAKTPMEDFLFLLVISLAVAVSIVSKRQFADRIVLAERRQTSEAVSADVREKLPVMEMPEDEGGKILFQSLEFSDREQLLSHLKQNIEPSQLGDSEPDILLRVEYNRPSGEVVELEDRMTELGIDICTEWEKRK